LLFMSVRVRDLLMRELDVLRYEPIDKRIRATLGDDTVIDSTRAMLVWEPKRVVPTYAVPSEDVDGEILSVPRSETGDFDAFDAWYEEDERNLGHPRDPFHRTAQPQGRPGADRRAGLRARLSPGPDATAAGRGDRRPSRRRLARLPRRPRHHRGSRRSDRPSGSSARGFGRRSCMSEARRAPAPVVVGGTPQVGAARVERFDVDEQHGGAPWLVCGGRAAMSAPPASVPTHGARAPARRQGAIGGNVLTPRVGAVGSNPEAPAATLIAWSRQAQGSS